MPALKPDMDAVMIYTLKAPVAVDYGVMKMLQD